MNNIQKETYFNTSQHIINVDQKKEFPILSDTLLKSIFSFFSKKEPEIYHLGGTNLASIDPKDSLLKLYTKEYFYERIPLEDTTRKKIFIYGKILEPYVKEWISKLKSEETKLENFQNYMLEKMKLDKELENHLTNNSVRYFNDAERQQTRTSIINGTLQQIGLDSETQELKPLKEGEFAFVIANTKDSLSEKAIPTFFASPKTTTSQGKIQHSSFTRSGNILSAGILKIDTDGKILSIRNHSGHYKPTPKELAYAINYLKQANYDISSINIFYFTSGWIRRFSKGFIRDLGKMLGLKWGIVSQQANIWYQQTGSKLLNNHSE